MTDTTQTAAPASDDERIGFIAAILEEWDMKPPPDETCGHSYRDIAADVWTRALAPKDQS